MKTISQSHCYSNGFSRCLANQGTTYPQGAQTKTPPHPPTIQYPPHKPSTPQPSLNDTPPQPNINNHRLARHNHSPLPHLQRTSQHPSSHARTTSSRSIQLLHNHFLPLNISSQHRVFLVPETRASFCVE